MRIAQLFSRLIASAAAVLALQASAADIRPGVEFDYLPKAMPTEPAGKIEVVEFFWYGCPHCNHLEPAVQAWAKTLPPEVAFRREHVLWNGRTDMDGHARLFVALKTMNQVNALTPKVFDAVHRDKIELRDPAVAVDWATKQGLNRAQFESAYNGFGTAALLARAKQMSHDYDIDGVPTFVINGKYKTSPSKVGGGDQRFFEVINALIAKEKAAK